MYFMTNEKHKVIFGWSAKCGCSHIKKIFLFLNNTKYINNYVHIQITYGKLPKNIENYKVILIIRNPYKRIISGFLDKYKKNGSYFKDWKTNLPLTFTNFVDKLIEPNTIINKHHFTQQLSEEFNDIIRTHKELIIYDIEKIDYKYIETIFNTIIPLELINFKGGHEYKPSEILDKYVFDLLQTEYDKFKPLTKCFYNDIIKEKVYNYYKVDFEFFKEKGFIYDII